MTRNAPLCAQSKGDYVVRGRIAIARKLCVQQWIINIDTRRVSPVGQDHHNMPLSTFTINVGVSAIKTVELFMSIFWITIPNFPRFNTSQGSEEVTRVIEEERRESNIAKFGAELFPILGLSMTVAGIQ